MKSSLLKYFLFTMVLLYGCSENQPAPVVLEDIAYKKTKPIEVSVDSSGRPIDFVKKEIRLKYGISAGDTLSVHILEFKSDVYALDYYTNSGRFQGSSPILRGDFIEQSIRAGSKLFIFNYDSFRHYERSDLEKYVQTFPDCQGGFPQEFLSFPFSNRVSGKSSVQTKFFLGNIATFPVLIQEYQENGLRWSVARSWDTVEQEDFQRWSSGLKKTTPKNIRQQSDCIYFTAGDGSQGIAQQLDGGRVVVLWGYLDWFDLERAFFNASDRIYAARF